MGLQLAQLAGACTQELPSKRPTMRKAVVALMTLSSTTQDWDVGASTKNSSTTTIVWILNSDHIYSRMLLGSANSIASEWRSYLCIRRQTNEIYKEMVITVWECIYLVKLWIFSKRFTRNESLQLLLCLLLSLFIHHEFTVTDGFEFVHQADNKGMTIFTPNTIHVISNPHRPKLWKAPLCLLLGSPV